MLVEYVAVIRSVWQAAASHDYLPCNAADILKKWNLRYVALYIAPEPQVVYYRKVCFRP
jgi:hypothetical protein